jgi:hypothetical protein
MERDTDSEKPRKELLADPPRYIQEPERRKILTITKAKA